MICTLASAQGVNRVVQVENNYISELPGVQKMDLPMSIPDSLLHFDYDFDYSVFETPFKGAYEFTPYNVFVQPDASVYDGSKFYLKAGAGYSLHPVLKFVAAPVVRKDRVFSIYNDGSGFIGRYAGNPHSVYGREETFTGYEYSDRLGAELRWMSPKYYASADVNYNIIGAGDDPVKKNSVTNAVRFTASLEPAVYANFFYSIKVGAGLFESNGSAETKARGFNTFAAVTLGQGQGDGRFLADLYVGLDRMDLDIGYGARTNNYPLYSVTPHYDFELGSAKIRAGVRLDYTDQFSVAPDVRVDANVLDGRLNLFAGADGGQSLVDFVSLKSAFRRAEGSHCVNGISREYFNIFAGLGGHSGNVFQYGLTLGYRNYGSTPVETLYGYRYASVARLYLDGRFSVKSERVDVDANFSVGENWLFSDVDMFAPALFSGDIRAVYNWNKRIYAGLRAEGRTKRPGHFLGSESEISLPGYADLGVTAEYKVTSKFGLWLESGNLLCQDIWVTPLYAETDPYFTAGICLKF